MKFLTKLFAKIKALFSKEVPVVAPVDFPRPAPRTFEVPTPSNAHVPSLPGIGKFAPPPDPGQPVNTQTNGWPVGAYEFQPGVWYVPDPLTGQHGGPFKAPAEAITWLTQVADWKTTQDARDKAAAIAAQDMQPGQIFDIRNLDVEDLKFLKMNSQKLQMVVGPSFHRRQFVNWAEFQGGDAPSAAAEAAADVLRGNTPIDVSGYNGPLKQYV